MWRIMIATALGITSGVALGQNEGKPAVPASQPVLRAEPLRIPAAQRLQLRLAAIEFDAAPLEDVFAQVALAANVNLVVRWELLAEVGIERDKPISMSVRNLRLRQVLWLVLNEAAGDDVKLAYRADDNLILVSTLEDFNSSLVTRVYDVRDLIMPIPRDAGFASERTQDVPISVQPQVAGGAVGVRPIIRRYSSGVYFGEEGQRLFDEERADDEREENLRKLIEAVITSIEPDSWMVNGGRGTIVAFRGRIVVRNSPLVHQKLGGAVRE